MTETHSSRRRGTLLGLILGSSIVYGILLAALYFRWGGPGPILAVFPWFVPLISLFHALIHGSIAFLALGRFSVLREPDSFWIGVGSGGFGVSLVFYALCWPGLLPGGESILPALPSTPAWFLQIGITILSSFWLAAASARRPSGTHLAGRRLIFLTMAWIGGLIFAFILLVGADKSLPVLVAPNGLFTPALLAWNGVAALLFALGTALSTRKYYRSGDVLLGYIAFAQAGFAFAALATVMGMRRYDVWWYLLRTILTAGGLFVLFGLLAEYVTLFRREREKTQQLILAKKTAEEASRAKDTFLINMSHELRTPLTVNMGMLELAKLSVGSDKQLLYYLDNAGRSAESLLQMIESILEVRSMQEKSLPPAKEPFDLITCCREVLDQLIPPAEKKGLVCGIHLSSCLPREVVGDCDRVKKILFHLIGNAIKFTEEGKIEVGIRPEGKDADGRVRVRFEIRDTGIGIPEDKLHLIFEPFTQADSSLTRRYGGAGLGLAISKEVVQMLGGELEVQSASGEGSVFSFALPFEEAGRSKETAPIVNAEQTKKTRPGKSVRILVVEDDPMIAELLGMFLNRAGYEAQMAEHGRKALEILEQEAFDLILMDLKMPVMDGYEAASQIRRREEWRTIPIIALTAHARSEEKEKCLAIGMNDFLTKPVDSPQLYAAIEKHLLPREVVG